MRLNRAWRGQAFTLIELAVVLMIVGLLLSSVTYTLSAQVDQRDFEETRRRLDQARELVIAFAIANGRLPCPARYVDASSNSLGRESFCAAATGGCSGSETTTVQAHGNCSNYYDGYLPAGSVGFQTVDSNGFAVDAWTNRIRYVVTKTTPTCAAANALVYTSTSNLKTYGVSFAHGSSGLPNVPSLAQAADIPGYDIGAWIGYAAAPGTPREIIARLSAEIAKAIQSPELRERFMALGLEPTANSPEEMAAYLKKEQQRYGDIIRAANIKIEQ